jgi:hypothetical protein
MGAVLELLGLLIARVSGILGIVQALQSIIGATATEEQANEIETIAAEGTNAVTNPISGVPAIWGFVNTLQSGGTPSLQTITDLIDALTPVTLPPEPPITYGPSIAQAVWDHAIYEPWWGNYQQVRSIDAVVYDLACNLEGMTGAAGWQDRRAPDFALTGYSPDIMWGALWGPPPAQPIPCPIETDWADWDGSETLVAFLTRVQSYFEWSDAGPAGFSVPGMAFAHIPGYSGLKWRCLVTEGDLPLRSGRLWDALKGLSIGLPPIWPGLSGVTLGTPVALDQGIEVVGPLHGVLLDITGMERLIPYATAGPFKTYRNLGRFLFYNDDGWQEDWRGVPSDHCQLLPERMAIAGGWWGSFYTGVTGTATPFTIGGA